jgi:hypothetical protein
MVQERQPWPVEDRDGLRETDNFGATELIHVPHVKGGHGGGENSMKDMMFRTPAPPDPLKQSAGIRDGARSVLIGIAVRKSIDSGLPFHIADLSPIVPQAVRPG